MLDEVTLEKRLNNLEETVYKLKNQFEHQSNSDNWLQQLIGSISDEELFEEVLEYGRAFRQSDQQTEETKQS